MATSTYTYSLRNIRLRRLADHERPLNDPLRNGAWLRRRGSSHGTGKIITHDRWEELRRCRRSSAAVTSGSRFVSQAEGECGRGTYSSMCGCRGCREDPGDHLHRAATWRCTLENREEAPNAISCPADEVSPIHLGQRQVRTIRCQAHIPTLVGPSRRIKQLRYEILQWAAPAVIARELEPRLRRPFLAGQYPRVVRG